MLLNQTDHTYGGRRMRIPIIVFLTLSLFLSSSGQCATNTARPDANVPWAIYLDGALQGAMEKGEEFAGTGSVRFYFKKNDHSNYTLSVAIAADDETKNRTSGFGTSLLTMAGSDRSGYIRGLDTRWEDNELWGMFDGFSWYAGVSNSAWSILNEEGELTDNSANTTVIGLEAAFVNRLLDIDSENRIYVDLNFGAAFRSIGGDLSDEQLTANLQQSNSSYYGLKAGFALGFNTITASADVYVMGSSGEEHVDGLTGLQAIIQIAVSADAFKGND